MLSHLGVGPGIEVLALSEKLRKINGDSRWRFLDSFLKSSAALANLSVSIFNPIPQPGQVIGRKT